MDEAGPTTIYMPKARVDKRKVSRSGNDEEPKVWPFCEGKGGERHIIKEMTIGYSKNSLGDLIMSVDMHSEQSLSDGGDEPGSYNRNLIAFGGLDNFVRVINIPKWEEYDADKECYQEDHFRHPIERPNRVRATKFNHDGTSLAIGGSDCRIGLYEVRTFAASSCFIFILVRCKRVSKLTFAPYIWS